MSGSQAAQPGALFLAGDEIMNILKLVALAVAILSASFVYAAEPTPTQTVEAQAASAAAKAAEEVRARAAAVAERAAEAARRSTLTFTEARMEDAGRVWAGTKWVACQAARGVTNADGYVAASVARPAGYVAERSFMTAADLGTAAAAIK